MLFELQCKIRNGQPSCLREWLRRIVASASARDRIGVVVWKEPGRGRNDDDALVIMRWKDFVALHGTNHASAEEAYESETSIP